MIDAPQFSRSDENKRILLFCDVINRQVIIGEWYHQSACTLYKHHVVAAGKFLRGTFYLAEVNGTVVYPGGEVGGKIGRASCRERVLSHV